MTTLICNCNQTLPLQTRSLGQALGEDLKEHSTLCRREAGAFQRAAQGQDTVVVACTQEQRLFAELAEQTEGAVAPIRFVNIRETGGWSRDAASASPKLAALLASARLPEPEPVSTVTYTSQGRVLVVGPLDDAETLAASLSERGGAKVTSVIGDISKEEDTKAIVKQVEAALGPISILVNCAGVAPAARLVGRDGPMALDGFERVVRVNLVGTVNLMRLAAAAMSRLEPQAGGERGVIVNTASVAAFEGLTPYCAAKGGIDMLVRSLAAEWGRTAPDVWRFKLREGVVFHDGTPFDADDVLASFARITQDQSAYRGAMSTIREIRRIGDFEIDVVTDTLPFLFCALSASACSYRALRGSPDRSAASLTAVLSGNSGSRQRRMRSPCAPVATTGWSCTSKTNSPRWCSGRSASQAGRSCAARVTICSNCLVSSRPTVTSRLPSTASASASAAMRCGASSNSTARPSWAMACTACWRSAALLGKKPVNTKPSPVMPAALSKVVTLLAPGSGMTRKPAARTACTRRAPGSLMAGVPASLT